MSTGKSIPFSVAGGHLPQITFRNPTGVSGMENQNWPDRAGERLKKSLVGPSNLVISC